MGPMMVCDDMAQGKAVHKHNASKMGVREGPGQVGVAFLLR